MKLRFSLMFLLAGYGVFAQPENKKMTATATQTQQKEKFVVIEGFMENGPNDSLVYIWDPYNGFVDSAIISKGRFTFKSPMKYGGTIHILSIGKKPDMTKVKLMYVQDGKMTIRGKGVDLAHAKYSGDKWVHEWEEVNEMFIDKSKGETKAYEEAKQAWSKAMMIGDEDAAEKYQKIGDDIDSSRYPKIKDWIARHPQSGVSTYLIMVFYPGTPPDGKKRREEIIALLGDGAKESNIYKRLLSPSKEKINKLVKLNAEGETGKASGATEAPDFSVPDVNGKIIKLSDFKGKYVFLDFWASWCAPCKPLIPGFKAAYEKFKDKNFEFIAVSLDSHKEAWTKAIAKEELTWLNVSSLKGWAEPVAVAYGIRAVPANVLIGPDGKILATGLNGEKLEQKLTELIK